jgi:hypothetical protein
MKNVNYLGHSDLVSDQDNDQDAPVNLEEKTFDFCSSPRSKKDI